MPRFFRISAACLTLALGPPVLAQEAPPPAALVEPTVPAAEAPVSARGLAPALPAAEAPVPATDPGGPALAADDQGPRTPGDPATGESLLGTLVKMLLVLGLVVVIIYLTLNVGLRRLMNAIPAQQSLVKLHGRTPLEPKKSIYLVEVAGEFLLLGVGEREVSLLSRLDGDRAREALEKRRGPPGAAPRPFWQRLTERQPGRRFLGKPPGEGPA